LELECANTLSGKVNAQVTAEGLTDAEAEARSEFIENVTDNGDNHKLIVIAPHGGNAFSIFHFLYSLVLISIWLIL